jgi:hypothetical protein
VWIDDEINKNNMIAFRTGLSILFASIVREGDGSVLFPSQALPNIYDEVDSLSLSAHCINLPVPPGQARTNRVSAVNLIGSNPVL